VWVWPSAALLTRSEGGNDARRDVDLARDGEIDADRLGAHCEPPEEIDNPLDALPRLLETAAMHTLVRSVALSSALLLSTTACGVGTDGLRAKAAADSGCDPQALTIHGTGMAYVERVMGCGKDNVYFYQRGEQASDVGTWSSRFMMPAPSRRS